MNSMTSARSIRPRSFPLNASRAAAVVGATLGAAAVWAVAVPILGVQLVVRFPGGVSQGIGIDAVVVSALVGSLAGWGVLALLERQTVRAGAIWTGLAAAGVAASLALPLSFGTTVSNKAALAFMHLTVGLVLIPSLRRGASR